MSENTEKVDKFLYNILFQNYVTNCGNPAAEFLQKSEETIILFVQRDERSELEFPPLNSFYRRIIHCLGRRYNLVHRVEPTNVFNSTTTLRKIYLTKPLGFSHVPFLKSTDWIEVIERESGLIETSNLPKKPKKLRKPTSEAKPEIVTKIKILKREPATVKIEEKSVPAVLAFETLSLEEKEAKYQAARDRIFEGFVVEGLEGLEGKGEVKSSNESTTSEKCFTDSTLSSTTTSSVNHSVNTVNHPVNTVNHFTTTTTTTATTAALNPEAVPFTFSPLSPMEFVEEPVIEINHIYTLRPVGATTELTRDHLKEILTVLPTATIKFHRLPTNLAFILLKPGDKIENLCSDQWTITKWSCEFYLD